MSDEYDDIKKRVASTGFVAEPVPEFQELGIVALSEVASQQFVEMSAARAIIREQRAEVERMKEQVREARGIIAALASVVNRWTHRVNYADIGPIADKANEWLAANPKEK